MAKKAIILLEQVEPKITTVRGHKVILDSDLATQYGTSTKVLNQAVKRNLARFPSSFMFALTAPEAASTLNTPRAVEVSIFVVQAFVKLRQFASNHKEIQQKLTDLERTVSGHDDAIQQIVVALRQLMTPKDESKPKRRIGFHVIKDDGTDAKGKK